MYSLYLIGAATVYPPLEFIEDQVLVRNKLLTTIVPRLDKTFSVRFEMNPSAYQGGWTNVIHFTTGGNCCNNGKL